MWYTALLFGLISSFHCIGMCGPIAMMLPVDADNSVRKALQISTYHLGRLSAYAFIGLLFGALGKGFFLAGIQQQLSIAIGILMIVFILVPERKLAQFNGAKPIYKIIAHVKSALGKQFKNKSYSSLFTIGLLNGFLPCAMIYVALFGAIAMQSVTLGVGYMLLFGIGTLPLMSLVIYVNTFITAGFRNKVQKIIPYAAVLVGCLFILRGLGLGIPYLSPSTMSLFVTQNPNCF